MKLYVAVVIRNDLNPLKIAPIVCNDEGDMSIWSSREEAESELLDHRFFQHFNGQIIEIEANP